MPRYYIGTSGWHYEDWKGLFYPEKLPRTQWLRFYANHFNSVEINNSFYRLPSEAAFVQWRDSVPDIFTCTVKVSRFITHIKRLQDIEEPLAKFTSRVCLLGDKLGVLLYQLPPQMKRNEKILEPFLYLLKPGLRHVFEFRHESWMDDFVLNLLQRYGVGFCVFDMPGFTSPVVATADFAYIRFHGSKRLYRSCYSEEELMMWARSVAKIGKSLKAVYIYFNIDAAACAVANAKRLRQLLWEEES